MKNLLKQFGKYIKIHIASETIDDPLEKNKIKTLLSSLPIKAIVIDLTATQARWKLSGIDIANAKEIYIDKKYRTLLELSEKIEIDGEYFEGWKNYGKMQIREVDNYLRVYIYNKKR